jgi:transposase
MQPIIGAVGRSAATSHDERDETAYRRHTGADASARPRQNENRTLVGTYVRDDRPWGDQTPPAVWYAYTPDRKGEHPQAHLSEFRGTLQADAYPGYEEIYKGGRVREAACMAHVRRPFFELYEAHKSAVAKEALERIAALYAIEEEIRGRSAEERQAVRNERSKPLLESLTKWFEETLVKLSRKSDTTRAIRYALDRWDALTSYCDDGHLEIDNNAAERSLRKVVLGKKTICSVDRMPGVNAQRRSMG